MKIAVIGLGNIAQKAYLPVMGAMREEVDWLLCSRDQTKRQQIAAKYGFQVGVTTLEEVLAAKVDGCLIHTPTPTHVALIEPLLEAGIAVYVDKPLSEDPAEVERLQQKAQALGVPLMVGFNRRYAPYMQQLKKEPKTQIIAQKHRVQAENPVRFGLFDLVIHPLDTALYLFDTEPQLVYSSVTVTGEHLASVFAHLKSAEQEAFVSVHLQAGVNEEQTTIRGPKASVDVLNLSQWTKKTASGTTSLTFGDWEATLEKRGFAAILRKFIEVVRAGEYSAEEMHQDLLSHQLCAQIYENFVKNQ